MASGPVPETVDRPPPAPPTRYEALVDEQLRRTMGFLFRTMKIVVEPACVASTAALLWPLRERLIGKRVALVMCGSNIDWDTFEEQAIFDDGVD